MLEGKVTDYGDLLHVEQWLVKGRRLSFQWHIGRPVEVSPDERVSASVARTSDDQPNRGADVVMDLAADKKVTLSGRWSDEVGNPTAMPDGATVSYTNDNPTVINLTDNGDGTAVAAATGTLGTANVHAVANAPGLPQATADLQIVVVAGDADRFEVVAGEPTEVTPDGEPEPTPPA